MADRSKRPVEALSRTIVVSRDVLDLLAPVAAQRGLTVNSLCREILGTVADDPSLIRDLLDD